jgi:ATP-dependent DNA helicase RecG
MNLAQVSVEELPGVGRQRTQDLRKLGIESIQDLLEYYPYRYEDTHLTDLAQAEDNTKVTIVGTLLTVPSIKWFHKKKSRMTAYLEIRGARISVVWFNQAFIKEKLQVGKLIGVTGKWDRSRSQILADRTYSSEKEQNEHIGKLQAIYSISGSITVKWVRNLVRTSFKMYGAYIKEVLPSQFISRYKLLPRAKAMYLMHFPEKSEQQVQARRRMVYEELFLYELKVLWLRETYQKSVKGIIHSYNVNQINAFVNQLPFPLTSAQKRVVDEVLTDLEGSSQMNRLLQGDVGSGKTVVASIALYANFLSGYQGALMVPTEILAEQHFLSLQETFHSYPVTIVLLTGSMTMKERREVLSQIEMGTADIVVGTHALIQDPVNYNKLGLAIIDEQHRFGVRQRSILREKGESPDVLFMTATPIPRTLSITVFGEMDVSTIDEMPKGREPI